MQPKNLFRFTFFSVKRVRLGYRLGLTPRLCCRSKSQASQFRLGKIVKNLFGLETTWNRPSTRLVSGACSGRRCSRRPCPSMAACGRARGGLTRTRPSPRGAAARCGSTLCGPWSAAASPHPPPAAVTRFILFKWLYEKRYFWKTYYETVPFLEAYWTLGLVFAFCTLSKQMAGKEILPDRIFMFM